MKWKNNNKVVSHVFRILIGCVFITSAILKYLAIDVFDLYIYEHNLFNLAITSTLTRLLIAAEFALGIFLIGNIYIRFTYLLTYLFLIGFTVYLILQPFLFRVSLDNCYCFGDKIVLNHTQSLLKNVILMLMLWLVNVRFYNRKKYEMPVCIIVSLVSVSSFMMVNAPDYLYTKMFHSEVRINQDLYAKTLQKTDKFESFNDGRHLICMYSHKCKYCKNASIKIDKLRKRNNISVERIKCIFWEKADSTGINDFFIKNNIDRLEYTQIPVLDFLNITHGQMPVILFSDNGRIIKSVNYAGITEKELVEFLNGKEID